MRMQATGARRLLGAAVVGVLAMGSLTGCVLAPVVSTIFDPGGSEDSVDAPVATSDRRESGSAREDDVENEMFAPEAVPSTGASDNPETETATPEPDSAEESDSSEDGVFGPPREDPEAPRVTVRIELPQES